MELFNQGLTLMTYGISTVFIFLALLIAAMTIMSSLLSKYSDPTESNESNSSQSSHNQINNNTHVDSNILQAIKEAITEHRNQRSL